jgi:hypothetical protein
VSGPGSVAASTGLGALLGAGAASLSLIALAALQRAPGRIEARLALGSLLRIGGALVGIIIGLRLRPASPAGFVLAFLISYVALQGMAVFGIRSKVPRKGHGTTSQGD